MRLPARHTCLAPILALLSGPALAAGPISEVVCDQTPRLEARLAGQMNQRRQAMGLRDPEQMMEVWLAPSGDWSLVVAYATGRSCIVAMGEAWQGGLAPRGDSSRDPT
ncbi:hypothetical protein [Pseudooceanicola sp. 200-1SW]|uniref:hypothetical protein n=1 Tax=Pseudooceanicola sp. 200-1SW TaxID=3425949 RepID=UPI003D7FC580